MKIILTVGIPGIGKSSSIKDFIDKNKGSKFCYLNADSIRKELTNDENDQSKNKEVFEILFERFEKALESKLDFIFIDNTNICFSLRKKYYEIAFKKGIYNFELWFFDTDIEKAKIQNEKRKRKVSLKVIKKFAQRFEDERYFERFFRNRFFT